MLYKSEGRAWGECVEGNQKRWEAFNSRASFRVVDGQKVKFWKQRWCDDLPLGVVFSTLFSITTTKDASSPGVGVGRGGGLLGTLGSQNRFIFFGSFGRGVMREVETFFRKLQAWSICGDIGDSF